MAKIFRIDRTRTQLGIDIYNVTNTDIVTNFNQKYVPNGAWLTQRVSSPRDT